MFRIPLKGIVSQAQAQGSREYQEDFIVHVPFNNLRGERGHLIGVLDGHGGEAVARECAFLVETFFHPEVEDAAWELQRIVALLAKFASPYKCGSTLSLALINETRRVVTTAVLGDSPIIVLDLNNQVQVSEEHNVRTNEAEREAVKRRGGIVGEDGFLYNAPNNDYGLPHDEGLQLTRALGDNVLRYLLDRTPAITQHKLSRHGVVIVGSDGLFDPSHYESNEESAGEIVAMIEAHKDAAAVLAWREERELDDNTSLIVWRPKRWWEWR